MHELLIKLEQLRIILNQDEDKMRLVEAYTYFTEGSDRGKECTYAIKCKKAFKKTIYPMVKTKIEEIHGLLKED